MLEANYDEVICPNCVTQFRAIPVNVQNQITALTAERDAYAAAADSMAMSHKVERDALTAANRDLQAWFDVVKADHDKLKDASRLALEALENTLCHLQFHLPENMIKRYREPYEALKAVL